MNDPRRHASDPDVIGQTAGLVNFLRDMVHSSHQRQRDDRSRERLWSARLPEPVHRPAGGAPYAVKKPVTCRGPTEHGWIAGRRWAARERAEQPLREVYDRLYAWHQKLPGRTTRRNSSWARGFDLGRPGR